VDNATTECEARDWITKLTTFLDLSYASSESRTTNRTQSIPEYVKETFPSSTQSSLLLLPTHLLSYGPLYELLEGFKTDLAFQQNSFSEELRTFPIEKENELELYASRVAGTVAELCLELVFYHSELAISSHQRDHIVRAGGRMGIALQYVNISRDIATDAAMSRVYIPTSWLQLEGLTPREVIKRPDAPGVEKLRRGLLSKAFSIYKEAHGALAQIPTEARAPMRVAVESYMEIGRVIRESEETGGKPFTMKSGKATVSKWRRIAVAWKALNQG